MGKEFRSLSRYIRSNISFTTNNQLLRRSSMLLRLSELLPQTLKRKSHGIVESYKNSNEYQVRLNTMNNNIYSKIIRVDKMSVNR